MDRIELIKGDITQLDVDVVVNAANTSLLGGGGVDGAIHRAAGKGLLEECQALNGCPTGDAKITRGYNLLAKFVVHTVGPVWTDGLHDEQQLLMSCYKKSLDLAASYEQKTIAFPNISTGIFHFPKQKAAYIALEAVTEFLHRNKSFIKVVFCTFDDENYTIYKKLLNR